MKRVTALGAGFSVLLALTLFYAWYIKGGVTPWPASEGPTRWETVRDDLQDAGFQNVVCRFRYTEDMDEYPGLDYVSDISIDGDSHFPGNKRYRSGVPVIVTRVQVPRKEIPLNSEDIQNYDQQTLVQMFRDAGFNNLLVRQYHDLDPNLGLESRMEVLLQDDDTFAQGQQYPRSIPIVVAVHLPAPMYPMTVNAQLPEDVPVRLFLDGTEVPRNGDVSWKMTVEEGEHTLTFRGTDDTIEGRRLTVTVDAPIRIHCTLGVGQSVAVESVCVSYEGAEEP